MDIPIQNIYYLLCYAWDKLAERDIVDVKNIDSTNLVDLFAKVLISGATHLLKRGVDRNYIPFDEDMQTIKGKINFPSTLSRNLLKRARAHCHFDELNHDILHNQLLKKTIYTLIVLDELDNKLRDELLRIYRYFHSISDVKISTKAFRSVRLNRNNYFYAFLLNVCELVYENLLPSEDKGQSKFRDFVKDDRQMAELFENFVRNFYHIEQKEFKVHREDIFWSYSGSDENFSLLPKMQTDISLSNDQRKIIIDTKFYIEAFQYNFDTEKIRSNNIYQMYAYLKQVEKKGGVNLSAEGILLYPSVKQEFSYSTILDNHKFSVISINLNQEWRVIHKDLIDLIK